MLNDDQINPYSNEDYQRTLADSLVESLGQERAIDTCYEHDWMETLKFVKRSKSDAVWH